MENVGGKIPGGKAEMDVVAGGNNDPLVRLIEKSTQDLHDRVNIQKEVMLNVLGRASCEIPIEFHPMLDEPFRKLLRQVLAETIEVLEETKKAFKSRRLEELRKRLMEVLKETA